MNNKMDCRIIQDLLPLYVDGLTSMYSNQQIEAHLKECPTCTQMLEYMKEPDDIVQVEEREVDFMRKIQKHLFRWKAFSGTILVFAVLLAIAGFTIHNRTSPKIFSDVVGFSSREVETCEVLDWSSMDEVPQNIYMDADDLIFILKSLDYYYEGVKENTMEGYLYYVKLFDTEEAELNYFWISEEGFLYTENSVYRISDSSHLLEFLDSLFRNSL